MECAVQLLPLSFGGDEWDWVAVLDHHVVQPIVSPAGLHRFWVQRMGPGLATVSGCAQGVFGIPRLTGGHSHSRAFPDSRVMTKVTLEGRSSNTRKQEERSDRHFPGSGALAQVTSRGRGLWHRSWSRARVARTG